MEEAREMPWHGLCVRTMLRLIRRGGCRSSVELGEIKVNLPGLLLDEQSRKGLIINRAVVIIAFVFTLELHIWKAWERFS